MSKVAEKVVLMRINEKKDKRDSKDNFQFGWNEDNK